MKKRFTFNQMEGFQLIASITSMLKEKIVRGTYQNTKAHLRKIIPEIIVNIYNQEKFKEIKL